MRALVFPMHACVPRLLTWSNINYHYLPGCELAPCCRSQLQRVSFFWSVHRCLSAALPVAISITAQRVSFPPFAPGCHSHICSTLCCHQPHHSPCGSELCSSVAASPPLWAEQAVFSSVVFSISHRQTTSHQVTHHQGG